MPKETNLWQDLYEAECKKSAKANFTVGWLTGCLRNHITSESVAKELEDARKNADRIFGN